MEYLTSPELHQLTGYARASSQCTWLREKGLPFRQDGKRLIVSREHIRAWLEGRPTIVSSGPNWAAVS